VPAVPERQFRKSLTAVQRQQVSLTQDLEVQAVEGEAAEVPVRDEGMPGAKAGVPDRAREQAVAEVTVPEDKGI
jgi:hypothetical protein